MPNPANETFVCQTIHHHINRLTLPVGSNLDHTSPASVWRALACITRDLGFIMPDLSSLPPRGSRAANPTTIADVLLVDEASVAANAPAALAPPRRRGAPLRPAYDAERARLVALGYEIRDHASIMRWRLFLAAKPNDQRVLLCAQAPPVLQPILTRLFALGFTIDAVEFRDTFVCTTLRQSDQVPVVLDLLRWLNNYCCLVPTIGLPPAPWRVAVQHCLVQRVLAADRPNPASN